MKPAGVLFFNDTATTEIYTLSLHDALPISSAGVQSQVLSLPSTTPGVVEAAEEGEGCAAAGSGSSRSEEHTSELQSRQYVVCRLLLEKKTREPNARARLFAPMPIRRERVKA